MPDKLTVDLDTQRSRPGGRWWRAKAQLRQVNGECEEIYWDKLLGEAAAVGMLVGGLFIEGRSWIRPNILK